MPDHLSPAFFHLRDQEWFVGNDSARGPWAEDACHGGPPTGLLARALELQVGDKQLVRLTVDLIRPVPMGGFRIESDIRRQGRSVTTATANIVDERGRICAAANSLHLALVDLGPVPTTEEPSPRLADALPGPFPTIAGGHSLPTFGHAVEMAFPRDQPYSLGPSTAWMRTPPLLEGEAMSPFQRLCPLADCGNSFSRNADIDELSFINPDLTVTLHRRPTSCWLAARYRSAWESNGVGLARGTLFDEAGAVGSSQQTILLRSNCG